MTTMYPQDATCSHCGTTSEFMEIGSTSVFGSPDLDLRPAPLARHNSAYDVQRCPHCGYCAPDISVPLVAEAAKQLISSDVYQNQLNHADFPQVANTFICWALLSQTEGDSPSVTAWAFLKAAWACDDQEQDVLARYCRVRAAESFQQEIADGDMELNEPGSAEALLTDVLRRSGQFESAQVSCEQGLGMADNGTLQAILHFQQTLIARQDSGCHTIEQALAEES